MLLQLRGLKCSPCFLVTSVGVSVTFFFFPLCWPFPGGGLWIVCCRNAFYIFSPDSRVFFFSLELAMGCFSSYTIVFFLWGPANNGLTAPWKCKLRVLLTVIVVLLVLVIVCVRARVCALCLAVRCRRCFRWSTTTSLVLSPPLTLPGPVRFFSKNVMLGVFFFFSLLACLTKSFDFYCFCFLLCFNCDERHPFFSFLPPVSLLLWDININSIFSYLFSTLWYELPWCDLFPVLQAFGGCEKTKNVRVFPVLDENWSSLPTGLCLFTWLFLFDFVFFL